MKRILFISAFPLNQKTAGQDYSRRLVEDLVEKGHNVSLIYAEYPDHKLEISGKVNIIKSFKPRFINCFKKPQFHPIYTRRFNKKILRIIKNIANDYDMLYFDFSQVHIYAKYVNHPNKVLMCHDILYQKFNRKKSKLLFYIKYTEAHLLKMANIIITFSKKDNAILEEIYEQKAHAVNFYLKTGRFIYEVDKINEKRFCMYGAWNRQENTDALVFFINKILPFLDKDVYVDIIGGGLSCEYKEEIARYSNVRYLGFVENPVKNIAECQALIAPLHFGAGVKVKVIDALSSGTAVFGTDITFEGIEDNKDYRLLYKADKPEEYVTLINDWRSVCVNEKQNAADEFYYRYNANHFSDIIEYI